MTKLVDLHCHILPYVDDGALRTEESEQLLDMLYLQGVRVICATPHLREKMFETPDEEILAQFDELQAYAARRSYAVRLFLSREYHCDRLTRERMERGSLLRMGQESGKGRAEHIQDHGDGGDQSEPGIEIVKKRDYRD